MSDVQTEFWCSCFKFDQHIGNTAPNKILENGKHTQATLIGWHCKIKRSKKLENYIAILKVKSQHFSTTHAGLFPKA